MLVVVLLILCWTLNLNSQESVFLETEDGWKIHLKYLKPKRDNLPLLLLVHSQKENYTEWKNWFSLIESFGYGWAALDLRGHGISVYKTDGSSQTYHSFSLSGSDNEYNKMIRDLDAAVVFLSSSGIKEDRIFVIGSHLGANVTAKFSIINKEIGGVVLINPYTSINDIPIIGLLRNYGKERPILIITPENNIKRIRDTILIYYLTRAKTNPSKTFIMITGNFTSPKDAPKSLIYRVLHWIDTPYLPEVINIEPNIIVATQSFISSQTTSYPSPYIIIPED